MRLILLFALAACSDAGGADAAPQAPPCPTGATVLEDVVTCGTCNGVACADGFHCTCEQICTWFEVFPHDGGVCAIDAGLPDGAL